MSDQDAAPDEEQEEETEEEQSDVDQADAEQKLAPGGTVKRKRPLLDLIRDTLPSDTRNYAVADVLAQRVEATYNGRGVSAQGGDPGVVGEFLVALRGLMEELGGVVVMRQLDFRSSVHVSLEPVVPNDKRERANALARENPNGAVQHEQLRDLIPDSVAAANAVARLLEVPSQVAIREARRYGAAVPPAYLRFARTVADRDGVVSLRVPGERRGSLDSLRAERVIARAHETQEMDPDQLTIVGKLTRTDSEEAMFRVVLDRDRMPPQFDARRRVVDGTYTPNAGRQVRQGGLWDQDVIAEVRAYPVRDPFKSKPMYDRFQFTSLQRPAAI